MTMCITTSLRAIGIVTICELFQSEDCDILSFTVTAASLTNWKKYYGGFFCFQSKESDGSEEKYETQTVKRNLYALLLELDAGKTTFSQLRVLSAGDDLSQVEISTYPVPKLVRTLYCVKPGSPVPRWAIAGKSLPFP